MIDYLISLSIWVSLGLLHMPFFKYWVLQDSNYTAQDRTFAIFFGSVFGPFALLTSIWCIALSKLFKIKAANPKSKIIIKRKG